MIAQEKLDPARVVEVLDWCHGVHHLSLALAALDLAQDRRAEQYGRLRTLLRAGQSQIVIEELERLGGGPARRLARVEGDPLLEETLRGGTTAVQLFQVPWCTAGERCDREHDSPGDQPSTKGNGIYWTEDNAEAVFQLRAAVVSGRWEEIVEQTREAMARDRRTDCAGHHRSVLRS